jgi:cytochrome c oxidase subunit 2
MLAALAWAVVVASDAAGDNGNAGPCSKPDQPCEPHAPLMDSIEAYERHLDALTLGSKRALDLLKAPSALPDLAIDVIGRQYAWRNVYRAASAGSTTPQRCSADEIVVPQGKSVHVNLTSEDLIHEWTVPELGIQVDAVPGRINSVVLPTSELALYSGSASKWSGKGYGAMKFRLRVVSQQAYEDWLRALIANGNCEGGSAQ